MANPNRVVGQARVTIDGITYPTSGDTTLELGGAKRDPQKGDYDASAFIETTEPSKVDVSINYKQGVSLSALRAMDNGTVVIAFDTGATWIIRNAYTAEPPSTGQDGKAKVVIQGPPAEEMF